MTNSALRIGAALVLILTTIGLADYFIKERPRDPVAMEEIAEPPMLPETPGTEALSSSAATQEPVMEEVPVETVSSSSSSRRVVKKGTSTKKKSGIDIPATLASLQLTTAPANEQSLLSLSAQGAKVDTVVLLFRNDRAALFSWIESDDVKTIFSSLKLALQEQFSPEITGLTDTTQTPPNGPPVDILSFRDPAISPEIVLFIRVRNRLYEFHIAESGSEVISQLIGELSK